MRLLDKIKTLRASGIVAHFPKEHIWAAAGLAFILCIWAISAPSATTSGTKTVHITLPGTEYSNAQSLNTLNLSTSNLNALNLSTSNLSTRSQVNAKASFIAQSIPAKTVLSHAAVTPVKTIAAKPSFTRREFTVKSGDSLSALFSRAQLSDRALYEFTSKNTDAKKLTRIMPGHKIVFFLDNTKKLQELTHVVDTLHSTHFTRTDSGFESLADTKIPDIKTAYREAFIDSSVFLAGQAVGMNNKLIMELANIFGWDVDFALDIRKGDHFSVLYEEKFLEGETLGNGAILAASFTNQGKTFSAVRFKEKDGTTNYFTPEGLSMRKAFLRAPLNFSYISSSFKRNRFHPILKRWKAHRGIDYRAPKGTPIKAAGDGKVIASTRNKYNGKYVFIQHGNGIVTKYLHMSKRAVSRGKRVSQGQTIGYVGATGLAEAPHLHYEFVVNGVHRNPRTVSLPQAKPIASSKKAAFQQVTTPLLAELNQYQQSMQLAKSNATSSLN